MTAPDTGAAALVLGAFAAGTAVPEEARSAAQRAWLDTLGVMLAGSIEPASVIVRRLCEQEGGRPRCTVVGTGLRTSAAAAALANGTAAHALDFDDMCFVSLAHPSAPLVAASLAAGELAGASGSSLLDAFVVGFEIEGVLGRALNPSHYGRGWHCTSTLGSIGAAAAAARILGLDPDATSHALSIAASQASGLKENFGTMTKPLHAGLAAQNGVRAALLAQSGFTASHAALDGSQGFAAATCDEPPTLRARAAALGRRWEILETGITVKLYPSCAATHPMLDALLDLRRAHPFTGDEVERIEVAVDAVTPTVLLYADPATGLEAKFSMQFCAAAAAARGHVGLETFDGEQVADPAVRRLLPRVSMRVDPQLGQEAPPMTQARVAVSLADGRRLTADADAARGYPARPAGRDELDAKFRSCARRALSSDVADAVLGELHAFAGIGDVRELTGRLGSDPGLREVPARPAVAQSWQP
jgi:2-methylcitrate dehydratase PrpD